jgi:selenocysteine lyase/cysteine desulfurase
MTPGDGLTDGTSNHGGPNPSATTLDERSRALKSFRDAVPVATSRAYLFSGGIAPASRPALDAMASWLDDWMWNPITHRSRYFEDLEACRLRLAALVRGEADSVAILSSTSRAANVATSLVAAAEGGNVVTDTTTYPSSLYPWLLPGHSGMEVRRLESTPESDPTRWERSIDSRTRAVVISHVDPDTGYRHDLARLSELTRSKGALLIVDAAQSVGAIEIDVEAMGVDILFGVGMKWLMGPPGTAFLWVRRDVLEAAPMVEASYTSASLDPLGVVLPARGARRLEHGVPNLPGLAGFRAALDLVAATGVGSIAWQIERLVTRCLQELGQRGWKTSTPSDPAHRAGVVVLHADDPGAIATELALNGVDVWGYPPRKRVRIDLHGFNTDQDLDRLLRVLDEFSPLPSAVTAS